ncbi:MAG: ABC transporter, partial [Comamonadaceae bacterium]
MQQHHHPVDASGVLTGPAGAELRARLAPSENVLAELQVDLSPELRFAPGVLALTSARVLARNAQGAVHEWPLESGMALRVIDHAGVGTLELHDASSRLALWRFTLGAHAGALRLVQAFDRQLARVSLPVGAPAAVEEEQETLCQDCGAPLPPDTEECPACARVQGPQTSTWVLLRLWRFARPYRKQLATGFALTVASTAATLVPPYMTIPLIDDILIPYQNGQAIPVTLVAMYLGGLLAAALLAWGLGWART